MKLFEDLEWGPAFKRAAFLVAFWLLALYVLTVAFPETFVLGLDSSAGVVSMLINAVLFFFFFAVFTAFTERSKRRRAAAIKAQRKGGTSARAAGAKNRSGAEAGAVAANG
jgi:uncharacterized membrane protein